MGLVRYYFAMSLGQKPMWSETHMGTDTWGGELLVAQTAVKVTLASKVSLADWSGTCMMLDFRRMRWPNMQKQLATK